MDKGYKALQDSILVTIANLQFIAKNTTVGNSLLIKCVIDTLEEQKKIIEHLSNCFETEKEIKNRCLFFISRKGLMNDFYHRKGD